MADIMRFLSIALVLFFLTFNSAYAETPEAAAESVNGQIDGAYGNKDGLKKRVVNPLTGDAPFVDLQGNETFYGKLSCPSSASFLEVTTSTDANGDITVALRQDTDINGSFDYTVSYPQISGICANGFLSCDPGTWSNCKPYKWVVTNKKIGVGLVPLSDLGGCYCVNKSCISSSFNVNKGLGDLGGGAVAAIQSTSPQYVVGNVVIAGVKITYYGQDNTCQAPSGQNSQYQSYYNDARNNDPYAAANLTARMESDSSAVTNSPTDDTGQIYQSLSSFSGATTGSPEYKTCALTKNATLSSVVTTQNFSGSTVVSVDFFLFGKVTKSGSNYLIQYAQTGPTSSPSYTTLHTFTSSKPNVNFSVNMTGASASCTSEGTVNLSSLDLYSTLATCSATGMQDVSLSFNATYYESDSTVVVNMTDTCGSIPSGCQLLKEETDGIVTYDNYQPTGASLPPTSCRDISGFTHCETFWEKKKTYLCQQGTGTSTGTDFTDALERSRSINDTVTDGGTAVTFTDRTVDENGIVSTTPQSFQRTVSGYENPLTTCEVACKVSVSSDGVAAAQSATGESVNASQYQVSTTPPTSVYFKKCSGSSGSYTCPLGTNEVLVTDCACPDDFTEAATRMDVLNQASKDMICSSGVPQ